MKPVLKAPGYQRLKVEHEKLLSIFSFKCNLRRYIKALPAVLVYERVTDLYLGGNQVDDAGVRRCRLTISNSMLKAPVVSALETIKS
jgi:hypothetical protein